MAKFDDFTEAYVEAMFWTDCGPDAEQGLQDATVASLAPETLEKILADCKSFQEANAAVIEEASGDDAIRVNQGKRYGGAASAGHDFWLTRNGHGAGFWDGDWGQYGDALDTAAKTYKSLDLYLGDDSKLYFG